jgi:carbonic anhydrase
MKNRLTPAAVAACAALAFTPAWGGGPAAEKAVERAEKRADKTHEMAADKPAEKTTDKSAEKRGEKHAEKPAEKAAEKPAARAAEASADPLERVRERLAEKLGAAKAAEAQNPNVVRVANRVTVDPPLPETAPARRPAAKPAAAKPAPAHAVHWDYKGEVGPAAWGGLRPDFGLCSSGKRQSPIDIRDGIAVDLEPVQFDYRASAFKVIDNGHTVQVNVAPGNFIHLGGRRWELAQFHFHRPSEERIDGRQFDMVAHLVHKDGDGKLAVVAVLLERGSAQPLVQTIWNHLPLEKHEEVAAPVVIDLAHLLPADRRYYTYMGSLTTPPCSEGVQWVVMRQPVQLSQTQIDIFGRLYPMNARPLQQAAGRLIKQSQ